MDHEEYEYEATILQEICYGWETPRSFVNADSEVLAAYPFWKNKICSFIELVQEPEQEYTKRNGIEVILLDFPELKIGVR